MRATIDKLTIKMIDSGMLSEKLEKTFKENLGFYVNRSYQVFDDPNWAKKVPQETRNRMKALLRSQYPEASPEQLENMMEKLLFVGKGSGSVIDVLASESIPLDVLTKRKDINKHCVSSGVNTLTLKLTSPSRLRRCLQPWLR